MDTMFALVLLAVILPILGFIGCVLLWRRSKSPWPAKLLLCVGIMGLLVPGTCFGLETVGEISGFLHTQHF